jgi:hypothetical protein
MPGTEPTVVQDEAGAVADMAMTLLLGKERGSGADRRKERGGRGEIA